VLIYTTCGATTAKHRFTELIPRTRFLSETRQRESARKPPAY